MGPCVRRDDETDTVIASAAKQSIFLSCCSMDCFAALAMTMGHGFTFSPHVFLREAFFYSRPLRIEGAGNAGRPMRPIATCAMVVVERTHVVRSHRNHPAFPTQWF